MIAQLMNDYQALRVAARARIQTIKVLEARLAEAQHLIGNLTRQAKDREAEITVEVAANKAEAKLTEAGIKNLATIKAKSDPTYLMLSGRIDGAKQEAAATEADLHAILREHALDKRELAAIASLSAAYAAEHDPEPRHAPQAQEAPTAPTAARAASAPIPF